MNVRRRYALPLNEKHLKAVLISFLVVFAGCGFYDCVQPKSHAAAIPHDACIQTTGGAIAVVRRAIKRRGYDLNGCEYRANRSGSHWSVIASDIPDPEEARAGRFPPPGSFTCYTISDDGRIVATMPGL